MTNSAQITVNGSTIVLGGCLTTVIQNSMVHSAIYREMFSTYTAIELISFTYAERKIALKPELDNLRKLHNVTMDYKSFNFAFLMVAGDGSQKIFADSKAYLQKLAHLTAKEVTYITECEIAYAKK